MVTLPELTAYDASARETLRRLSPAVAQYESALESADALLARRHRAWLACAAATLLDRRPAADVCAHWSDAADEILRAAWDDAGLGLIPAALFALGKLGARELNLSSDVDLVLVAEPDAVPAVTRALRAFRARLDGALRLDFDLRPGGSAAPLVTTPRQFEAHYWTHGEAWERLALVRLRPLAGPAALSREIEELAARFSYAKYLDFTVLEDLKGLRAAVHQRGFTRRPGEINLKLEVGGIRDVELFTHAQLVLNGGKNPRLQTRDTAEALGRLAEFGLLERATANALAKAYWDLRAIENRVQAKDDRQTHVLGTEDSAAPAVRAIMADVDARVSGLLGGVEPDGARLPLGPTEQRAWLKRLGFGEVAIQDAWPRLTRATALGRRGERDERARREFLFRFVTALGRQSGLDRDLGLSLLADFTRATRAKATLFTTLLRVPDLIEDLARVFSVSPHSGAILAAKPELIEHLVLPLEISWDPDPAVSLAQMAERRQLTELWATTHLLGGGALEDVFARETEVADEIASELLKRLHREFPKADVRVLALGKWGGRELGLRSDLDFIFVTAGTPGADDHKIARRFITRLTDPGRHGALYDVDLRLRPSGQSGPLMVTAERLEAYWAVEAAAWERQAYVRARPLAGGEVDRRALVARPLTKADFAELARIRGKLLRPATDAEIDVKYAPGGLVDIEFAAQIALLAGGVTDAPTSTDGMLERLRWAPLRRIYRELRRLEQHLQLASAHRLTRVRRAELARAAAPLNMSEDDLWTRLTTLPREARAEINALDPTGLKIEV